MDLRRFLGVALVVQLFVVACTESGSVLSRISPRRSGSPSGLGVLDVRGLTTTEADHALRGTGLLLEVEPVGGSDSVVISQSPEPGTQVPADSIVHVQARCFPAPCLFPGVGEEIYDPCTCAAR